MTYLFLLSKDSSNLYQNQWFDFIVNLSKGLELKEKKTENVCLSTLIVFLE